MAPSSPDFTMVVGLAVVLAVALLEVDGDALGGVGRFRGLEHAAGSPSASTPAGFSMKMCLRALTAISKCSGCRYGRRGDQHRVDVAERAGP